MQPLYLLLIYFAIEKRLGSQHEDFIFSLRKKDDKIPVVVKTIVTSDMSEEIAAFYIRFYQIFKT